MQATAARFTPFSGLAPCRSFTQPVGGSSPECRAVGSQIIAKQRTPAERRAKRHKSVRKRVIGDAERPRLAVFRSNHHIYAQVIDDQTGHTLAAASTVSKELKPDLAERSSADVKAATMVGKKLAEVCLAKDITKVCFDRGGFLYHGRVKALAEAAREGGLQF